MRTLGIGIEVYILLQAVVHVAYACALGHSSDVINDVTVEWNIPGGSSY